MHPRCVPSASEAVKRVLAVSERTVGIARECDGAHAAGKRVPEQKAAQQAFADAGDFLDSDRAEDASLCAGGSCIGGRFGVEATIARTATMGGEGGELAVELAHGRRHEGALSAGACVGEDEAGFEVVASIADEVVLFDEGAGVGGV